ncbi:bifunctional folylpolyglutamate synthase/dihydrofolate synthase [Haliangium ochraceum]|uniref:Dihydrofolate synthase/folylpolyglutamate synthase n=1 Tax=Haliangium ochraceum (strain DSM 14365 / JCM 11303 / SMP-2) TaxID=502025 RepID=D0LYA5_HALO1|nr:folylpolyglutamate synthase/dihydrofolate synthase family protein [Haliangium ochraceum]ACY16255.1 FolC bifunctional protein [Haliangium ochraceum DSM 14365]
MGTSATSDDAGAAPMQRLLSRLYAARRAGVVLGLERVHACLARLGHPERRMRVRVHIGGTNGKGSTAAFTEAIARAAGHRTGRFSSPHLHRFAERFVIDGAAVDDEALIAAGDAVAAAGGEQLTFFEQTTAMAMWLFAERGVEVGVIEVGLGGRLDATNAVSAEVAAVTGVAMDHQEYLGDTLAAIAAEKAGIFKPGQRVVVGRAGEREAVPWLVEAARAAGAAAVTVVQEPSPAALALRLRGPHQRDNAACALAIVEHLAILGHLDDNPARWRQAVAETRLPGRLEQVAPEVFVDGAHNPHAARALAASLDALPRPRVLVLAMSRDKDQAGIAAALLPAVDAVVVTAYEQERATPVAALAALVDELAPALHCERVPGAAAAVDRARELLKRGLLAGERPAGESGGSVLVAGSLFLVGEARAHLLGEARDPAALAENMTPGDAAAASAAGEAYTDNGKRRS